MRDWIAERRSAVDWLQGSSSWSLRLAPNRGRLPLSLKMYGERRCLERIYVQADRVREGDPYSPDQLAELFPEANVDLVWEQ